MGFSLKNHREKMGKISNNLELHGDEEVIAWDIPMKGEVKKGFCNKLLGDYADRVLWNTDGDVERPTELFDKCEPLDITERFDRAKAVIAVSDKKSYEFEECKISKIRVKPLTGGSAELSYTLRVKPTSNAEICALLEHQNREVTVDVTNAKVALKKSLKQGELGLEGGGQPEEGDGKDKPTNVEELFPKNGRRNGDDAGAPH